jgi:WD40 repeat protein
VKLVEFSPDGDLLLTQCQTKTILWEPNSGEPVRSLPEFVHPYMLAAFSPAGGWIATIDDDMQQARAVRVDNGDVTATLPLQGSRRRVLAAGFASEGRRFIATDLQSKWCELDMHSLARHPVSLDWEDAGMLYFSSDMTCVAARDNEYVVHIWRRKDALWRHLRLVFSWAITALIAAMFGWSAKRDRRSIARSRPVG